MSERYADLMQPKIRVKNQNQVEGKRILVVFITQNKRGGGDTAYQRKTVDHLLHTSAKCRDSTKKELNGKKRKNSLSRLLIR